MQCAGDVALNHLGAVAQHHQGGDGAEAAGAEVYGGAVVYLAVDYGVHEAHDVGGQLRHRRRGLGVVVRAVVAHTEVGGGLVQVGYQVFVFVVLFQLVLIFRIGLVGTEVGVFVVVFGGHGFTLFGLAFHPHPNPPPEGDGILGAVAGIFTLTLTFSLKGEGIFGRGEGIFGGFVIYRICQ